MVKFNNPICERFRRSVLYRDNYRCRVCGVDDCPLDVHHITEMPHGYVTENGISLCPACHERARVWHASNHTRWVPGYHPDDLYGLIGSTRELAWEASARFGSSHR
jgi:hypothetical protein